jgi:glucan phosphoethanolaminetransferase (alkaline phosphatase superfamily)
MAVVLARACAHARGWLKFVFTGRFRVVGLVMVVFCGISGVTRIALAILNADVAVFAPQRLLGWLLIGSVFDLSVAALIILPFAFFVWAAPDTARGRLWFAPIAIASVIVAVCTFLFVAAAEIVFWNEFGTRFNFIAVDYLIYTSEVIGNIRESYPLPLLVTGIALLAALLVALLMRPVWHATACAQTTLRQRSASLAALVVMATAGVAVLDDRLTHFTDHPASAQLASNGWFEFVHAFRNNEIDYTRFYRTLPAARAAAVLRTQLLSADGSVLAGVDALPFERQIVAAGPERRLNVVLISVESLSADFMAAFGNTRGLTPRLDALAQEGMLFTHLYRARTGSPDSFASADTGPFDRQAPEQRPPLLARPRVRTERLRGNLPVRRIQLLRQHARLFSRQRVHGAGPRPAR